jgi:uncharacterized protein YbjT (DUF2867 family)
MKKVLVLGGSGFVGSHVCEKLVREGWHVSVPTRRRDNARHLLPLPLVTVLELDVHDEAALTQAVAGHDAVVNLVAILHGDQAAFERTHVDLPQKLARACRASGVGRVVHVSALGVNASQPDQAPSMYLRSKGRGEAALVQAASGAAEPLGKPGFELTILRPSVIFGAGDKFLNLFASMQKVLPCVPLAGAQARFQPVWVEDVAAAVVFSLAQHGLPAKQPQVFELCGPEVFTLQQLVSLAGQLAGIAQGRGRRVFGLPDALARLQAFMMELLPGAPLMSRDNLDSMRVDNVAKPGQPGLASLGITPASLRAIAPDYLSEGQVGPGLLLRLRQRGH